MAEFDRQRGACGLALASFFVATLIASPAGAQSAAGPPAGGPGQPRPLIAAAAAPGPGAATSDQKNEEDKDPGNWDFIINPYLWVPNLNMDVEVGGVSTAATITLDEVLKVLNFGMMGSFEVQYQRRWFAGMDGVLSLLYAKTETDATIASLGPVTVTTPRLMITVPNISAQVGPVQIRSDISQFIALGYFGYRLRSGPVPDFLGGAGADGKKRLDVDAYVGGRLWYNKITTNVDGPPIFFPSTTGIVTPIGRPNLDLGRITIPADTTGPINIRVVESLWWVDPVVGGRVRMDLSDRYFLRVMGDVGGFNWGDASKFTWQGWAMIGRRVKKHWTVEAGYRGLGIIREKGGARADIIYQGPVLGGSYRF